MRITESQDGSEVQNVAPFPSPRRRLQHLLEDHVPDGGGMGEDDASIEEIRTFRQAVRRIIRSDRLRVEREKALIVLAAKAREAGPLAQDAAWKEAKPWLRNEPPPPPVQVNHPAEAAVRKQLRKGRVLCEACFLWLPPEEVWDRLRRERGAEIERRRLLEEAGE